MTRSSRSHRTKSNLGSLFGAMAAPKKERPQRCGCSMWRSWLDSFSSKKRRSLGSRRRPRPTEDWRLVRLEALERRWVLATLIVNTTADVVNPSDGTLSLRDAISAVDAGNADGLTAAELNQVYGAFGSNDTIEFSSALTGGIITLNGSALPTISASMTITGPGASNLAISGNDQSAVFVNGGTVQISGLTIEDGISTGVGGGIFNFGALTVSNCTLTGNSASGDYAEGGGIWNDGTLIVSNSTLSDNLATGDQYVVGGGIWSYGVLTVSNCTLSGNSASGDDGSGAGGGIWSNGTLTVSNSTLSENSATVAVNTPPVKAAAFTSTLGQQWSVIPLSQVTRPAVMAAAAVAYRTSPRSR
jgi:hypothetical protein